MSGPAAGPLGPRRGTTGFFLSTIATTAGIRCLLSDLRTRLEEAGLSPETCGTVEIVLAEALNNVAEHAYPPDSPGPVHVRVVIHQEGLTCELTDAGRAMPGLVVPAGTPPDTEGPSSTLPEGGFGWLLIHSLTTDLDYDHRNGHNRLSLTISA